MIVILLSHSWSFYILGSYAVVISVLGNPPTSLHPGAVVSLRDPTR